MDPSIRIDRQAATPLHRQIFEALLASIRSGAVQPGDRLPASRDLAGELEVNRVTVQSAYRDLQAAGWIVSHVGQGTFVAPLEGRDREGPHHPADESGAGRRPPRGLFSPHVERLYRSGEQGGELPGERADLIDFSGRIPDERLFNVDRFRDAIDLVLRQRGAELLQYGPPLGDADLRGWIAKRLRSRGIPAEADEILLIHGAQQGITLLATAFCESGERAITARPTYHLVLDIFAALGLDVRTVPLTPQGIDVARIERELRSGTPRLIYTMPDFQNPTGITQDAEVRRELVRLAARAGVPIIEDDFEHELRFRGEDLPPLAAQPESELVVHLGTFSKGLFPGLRVGWIRASRALLSRLLKLKQTFDLGGGSLIQAALYEFIASGEYESHLVELRRQLARKHERMGAALERHLSGRASWTRPEGGYAVWLELDPRVELAALQRESLREGVLFTPGDLFVNEIHPTPALRLTLSRVDPDQIDTGIAALARALEHCEGAPERPRSEESIPLI